jgi:hypothetical protein
MAKKNKEQAGLNARQILDEVLGDQQQQIAKKISADEFFEFFVAREVLRPFPLEVSEIEDGITDNGDDGGIDSAYLFVQGNLIDGDVTADDLENYQKNVLIDWILIQSKREVGFKQRAVELIEKTLRDSFDLKKTEKQLSKQYNTDIVAAIMRFRETRRILRSRWPDIEVNVYYATRGDAEALHPKVPDRKNDLESFVIGSLPKTKCTVHFLGARQLIDLASRIPKTQRALKYSSLMPAGKDGYICLVPLRSYYEFISENGQLLYPLFESNVRDYSPDYEVNKGIRATLTNRTPEDFWCLNNGITIITDKIAPETELEVNDPQIVNGLQTSQEIFGHFHDHPDTDDDRKLLVRVIRSQSTESQDRIINATNRQTAISADQLHATEPIHRDIERYFPPALYYDRRRNNWKYRDKPKDQVVGIKELAQILLAVFKQRPDTSRGRPGDSFTKKNVELYKELFPADKPHPLDFYLFSAVLHKKVETFLRTVKPKLDRRVKNDVRFYVSMCAACLATERAAPMPTDMAKQDAAKISDPVLGESLRIVNKIYERLGGTEKVAKGPQMREELKAVLASRFPVARRHAA